MILFLKMTFQNCILQKGFLSTINRFKYYTRCVPCCERVKFEITSCLYMYVWGIKFHLKLITISLCMLCLVYIYFFRNKNIFFVKICYVYMLIIYNCFVIKCKIQVTYQIQWYLEKDRKQNLFVKLFIKENWCVVN